MEHSYKINTSNAGKLAEYKAYLPGAVSSEAMDLREPEADALCIIRYKASQFEDVIVDDVSLEIEGTSISTDIKWHLDRLDEHIGRKARFICYLGICRKNEVHVFVGEVSGKMVAPRGNSFGFNPYFLPDQAKKTLGEEIPPQFNARYHAVQKLLKNQPDFVLEPLTDWNGKFQN